MASMMALFLSLPVSLYGQSEAKKTSSLAPLKKMSFAQIVKDSKDKHRKNALGSIRLEELKRFPMGKFYIDTSTYEPALLEVLTKNPKRYSLLVFGGFWWCPDTKTVVGKFLFYLEKTGWKSEQISFIGLDHEKKVPIIWNTYSTSLEYQPSSCWMKTERKKLE